MIYPVDSAIHLLNNRGLIGLLDCLYLLRLTRMITLVLFSRHLIENRCIIRFTYPVTEKSCAYFDVLCFVFDEFVVSSVFILVVDSIL